MHARSRDAGDAAAATAPQLALALSALFSGGCGLVSQPRAGGGAPPFVLLNAQLAHGAAMAAVRAAGTHIGDDASDEPPPPGSDAALAHAPFFLELRVALSPERLHAGAATVCPSAPAHGVTWSSATCVQAMRGMTGDAAAVGLPAGTMGVSLVYPGAPLRCCAVSRAALADAAARMDWSTVVVPPGGAATATQQ
jgi:hypothetical protein